MIRWIDETLGTGAFDKVPDAPSYVKIDVRNLVDKSGNGPAAILDQVAAVLRVLSKGQRAVVCCDYGISRSNAIAAGVIARRAGLPFDHAVRRVFEATGEVSIKLEVLTSVRAALGEGSTVTGPQRRILVTGGHGFLGRQVVERLRRSADVLAPTHAAADVQQSPLALDIAARSFGPDTIVHLASPRIYTNNEALGYTLTMLKNVLDVSLSQRARFVYMSSWEVFSGYRAAQLIADETLPCQPSGTYGLTKVLCEQLIESFCRREGLPATVIRSGPVYGVEADRPKFIFTFLGKAVIGAPISTHRYRNALPALDLLHVDDASSGVAEVVLRGDAGIVHLGSGQSVTTEAIARMILSEVRSDSELLEVEIQADIGNILMDATKARTLYGWAPTVSLPEGIRRLFHGLSAAEQGRQESNTGGRS